MNADNEGDGQYSVIIWGNGGKKETTHVETVQITDEEFVEYYKNGKVINGELFKLATIITGIRNLETANVIKKFITNGNRGVMPRVAVADLIVTRFGIKNAFGNFNVIFRTNDAKSKIKIEGETSTITNQFV